MKNIFKIVLFLLSVFSFSNIYANTGDIENTNTETESGFIISSVNVIDDRNLEIIFSKDLAREPLNLKLYNSINTETPINSVTIGTGNIKDGNESRKEVYVFTSTQLEKNTNYYVVISNARSMDGDIIKQEKKDINSTNILTGTGQLFKTEEKLNKSKASEIKNNIIENPNTINELRSASDKKIIETAKTIENTKNNIEDKKINPINDVSKLPKTGPGEIFIFVLLSLFFTGSLFYFRKINQI